jgi:hypothetical protein
MSGDLAFSRGPARGRYFFDGFLAVIAERLARFQQATKGVVDRMLQRVELGEDVGAMAPPLL